MKLAESILLLEDKARKGGNVTSTDSGHFHHFRVDLAGNGFTTFTSESENAENHIHDIFDFEVQEKNGHTHQIPKNEQLSLSSELPKFKTIYGLEHWLETRQKELVRTNGKVSVGNRIFNTIKQAAQELWKEQNEINSRS